MNEVPVPLFIAELKAQRDAHADAEALVSARCRQLEAENAGLRRELEALKTKDGSRES